MALNIKLDETYRLRSDMFQIILTKTVVAKEGKSKGKKTEQNFRYYPNVASAVNGYIALRLNTESYEIKTLKDYLTQLKKERGRVQDILEATA